MTQVEFHSDVPEPLHFACRLLRKAIGQGHRVLVTAAPETLQALDRALWTFDAQSFVPHVRLDAGPRSPADLARTPLLLAEQADTSVGAAVLVNLGADVAAHADGFSRIVEIVGRDADDVNGARGRWRAYMAGGLQPTHRSVAAKAAPAG